MQSKLSVCNQDAGRSNTDPVHPIASGRCRPIGPMQSLSSETYRLVRIIFGLETGDLGPSRPKFQCSSKRKNYSWYVRILEVRPSRLFQLQALQTPFGREFSMVWPFKSEIPNRRSLNWSFDWISRTARLKIKKPMRRTASGLFV